jgi:hypothetical protein
MLFLSKYEQDFYRYVDKIVLKLIFLEATDLPKMVFFFFLVGLGFHTCKADTLPPEPHLQSILLWLFWRWVSHKLFALVGLKPILPISASQ